MDYALLKDNVVVGYGSASDPDYQPPEGYTLGPAHGPEGHIWDGERYSPPPGMELVEVVNALRFCVMPGAFSGAECEQIIAMGNALPNASATVVPSRGDGRFSEFSPRQYDPRHRRSGLGWFRAERPGGAQWIFERIWALVRERNDAYFGLALSQVPDLQFTRYEAAQRGHFDWHTDALSFTDGLERKISVVAMLSRPEDYDGGVFEMAGIGGIELMRGMVLLFHSPIMHRVTPVTRGTRYSLVTWVQGPQ